MNNSIDRRHTGSCVTLHRVPLRRRFSMEDRMRKRRRQVPRIVPLIVGIVLVVVIIIGILFLVNRYTYGTDRADLNEYYGVLDENDYPVVYQDRLTESHARKIEGTYYLDLDTVRNLLNDRFYYGEADQKIFYCFPTQRLETSVGSNRWTMDTGETGTTRYNLSIMENDTLYIALDFVKTYTNFSYEVFTDPNRIRIYNQWDDVKVAPVTQDTSIRALGGIKSDIVADVSAGDDVYVLEVLEDWTRVETMDCQIGYVESDKLGKTATRQRIPVTDYKEPDFSHITFDSRINMVWHNVSVADGNSSYDDLIAETKDVNIVAPTWFSISSEEGRIDNKASREYVNKVHKAGMQLWAVLENFSSGTVYSDFLLTDARRSALINSLIQYVKAYDIDGINVDIEGLDSSMGPDFVEFVRELSIACRKNGTYLSVDNYVPYNFNDYYDLAEQATFCDYVVIMGYDEHYQSSTEAGSVASIGYVRYGIQQALKEVPADRLVNAVPFYTRIWTTTDGTTSSVAVGMDDVQDFLDEHNMTSSWDEEDGQNYAEKEEDGNLYQIWIEDEDSIRLKLDVMQENKLAGVAEWSLQFQSADIWDVIADYMEK